MVGLVRRWAVDWLAAADPAVCEEILAPQYTLLIGGYRLGPRDRYVPTTLEQINRFPGLGVTIHELIASEDGVALRFTEHGASPKLEGREAAWTGVAVFRSDGHQLTGCFAEEDYLSRRRQFDTGVCDPIEPPAAAPWNVAPRPRDPAAEETVLAWLQAGDLSAVDRDDSWFGGDADAVIGDGTLTVNALLSSGASVGFHATLAGADGLDRHLAGLVHVADGAVARGRVVRDRLGLQRAMAAAA